MTNDTEKEKFNQFHELVLNGVDYEDAIRKVEGLSDDFVLDEAIRELFEVMFQTEKLLDSMEKIPKDQLPMEELGILYSKMGQILGQIEEEDKENTSICYR